MTGTTDSWLTKCLNPGSAQCEPVLYNNRTIRSGLSICSCDGASHTGRTWCALIRFSRHVRLAVSPEAIRIPEARITNHQNCRACNAQPVARYCKMRYIGGRRLIGSTNGSSGCGLGGPPHCMLEIGAAQDVAASVSFCLSWRHPAGRYLADDYPANDVPSRSA